MIAEEPAFKIKNANVTLFVCHINTTDLEQLENELLARIVQTPDFFSSTPIVLGLTGIVPASVPLDFVRLMAFMSEHHIRVLGVTGGTYEQRIAAESVGLALFPETSVRRISSQFDTPPLPIAHVETAAPPLVAPVFRPTMIIDKPVRTGQRIYAEGANLVVLAIVNAGAELIADGDIHIYAPLRGRAIAGAHGNSEARIFAQKLEAELISIAGCFQVFENGVPEKLQGKAAHVKLDGSHLIMQLLTE